MSFVTEGTVGIWDALSSEQANGLIVEQIVVRTTSQKALILDTSGSPVGRSDYGELLEGSMNGERLSGDDWDQKLAAEITIANTLALTNSNEAGPGKTLVDEVERTLAREDWEKISVNFTSYPNMT